MGQLFALSTTASQSYRVPEVHTISPRLLSQARTQGGVRGVRTNPPIQLEVPFCSDFASSLVFVSLHQSKIVVCETSANVSVTL